MAKAGRGDDQYMVRFPDGLRDLIKAAAEKNGRSMNSEIVGRLEAYDAIYENMAEMSVERERLAAQLEETRVALSEQRAVSAGLQRLLNENHEEAMRDEETLSAIDKRYSELKAQSEYLESLKAELLEISKERDDIKAEAEDLVEQQQEAIRMLLESQRTTAAVLKDLANRREPEMTGTPLTPDLFDKLFNQLVRVEEKLGKSEK